LASLYLNKPPLSIEYLGSYTGNNLLYGMVSSGDIGIGHSTTDATGEAKIYFGIETDKLSRNKTNNWLGFVSPNMVMNVSGAGGFYVYNSSGAGTIGAGRFVAFSSVYDKSKGSAWDNVKDASELLNKDGTLNHSVSPAYTQVDVCTKTVTKDVVVQECDSFKNLTNIPPTAFNIQIKGCSLTATTKKQCNVYTSASEIPKNFIIKDISACYNYTNKVESCAEYGKQDAIDLEQLGNFNMQFNAESKNKTLALEQQVADLQKQNEDQQKQIDAQNDWKKKVIDCTANSKTWEDMKICESSVLACYQASDYQKCVEGIK
jgi:hypothetical protein